MTTLVLQSITNSLLLRFLGLIYSNKIPVHNYTHRYYYASMNSSGPSSPELVLLICVVVIPFLTTVMFSPPSLVSPSLYKCKLIYVSGTINLQCHQI